MFPIAHHSWCRHCTGADNILLTLPNLPWYFQRRPPTIQQVAFPSIFAETFSGFLSVFLAWHQSITFEYVGHVGNVGNVFSVGAAPSVKSLRGHYFTFMCNFRQLEKRMTHNPIKCPKTEAYQRFSVGCAMTHKKPTKPQNRGVSMLFRGSSHNPQNVF